MAAALAGAAAGAVIVAAANPQAPEKNNGNAGLAVLVIVVVVIAIAGVCMMLCTPVRQLLSRTAARWGWCGRAQSRDNDEEQADDNSNTAPAPARSISRRSSQRHGDAPPPYVSTAPSLVVQMPPLERPAVRLQYIEGRASDMDIPSEPLPAYKR
ncbi:hypothetical protein TWF696_001973 [Orbilia brochopaga]|uniref:Transmembrane protein n=1 Tax=Orbilia brochopaga TaxID=3140254 RepID=A0AAV9UAQ4_9PEZI